MKRGIIMMAKVPEPGKVKTRLQPYLTPEQSAAFAKCLLQDTISKAKTFENKLIVAYSPIERRDFFDSLKHHNVVLFAQTGETLGERIFNAFEFAFKNELDSILMIGTDSPTFPGDFLSTAFQILEQKDSVLGETEDGGFYLIGLRKLDWRIFENVEWSSEKTFEQTRNNLEKIGFSFAELPIWYDVDEPKDLERLRKDANLQEFAPKTYMWLEKFDTVNFQLHRLEVGGD